MAFQSVPATASAEVIWTYNTTPMENTFYFVHSSGAYTQTTLTTLATLVDAWVQSSMKALVSLAMTYNRTEVRGLEDENDFLISVATNTGLGTRSGNRLPSNVAMAIARKSVHTGRSARGRIYTFGMTDGDLLSTDKDRFAAAYQTAWLSALVTLGNNAALQAWTPCIVSRFHNGVKRAVGEVFILANWVNVNNEVDSRRDRLILD